MSQNNPIFHSIDTEEQIGKACTLGIKKSWIKVKASSSKQRLVILDLFGGNFMDEGIYFLLQLCCQDEGLISWNLYFELRTNLTFLPVEILF